MYKTPTSLTSKEAVEVSILEKKGIVEFDALELMKPNVNKERAEGEAEGTLFEASGIDGALGVLSIASFASKDEEDLHPERRMKGAYIAFEEKEMALLKEGE